MKRMPEQEIWKGKRVYKELFPDRMMKDYIRLEKVESPLLELIPELNKTAGLHQMAYKLVCALLWVHGKINGCVLSKQ